MVDSQATPAWLALIMTHRRGLALLIARNVKPSHYAATHGSAPISPGAYDELVQALDAASTFAPWSERTARQPLLPSRSREICDWIAAESEDLSGGASSVSAGLACIITAGSTLEAVADAYRRLLRTLDLTDRDIGALAVTTGPHGSFTGLRLGCALVAGLVRGRKRAVWALPTVKLDVLSLLAVSLGGKAAGRWLSPWDATPSAVDVAPVTRIDLLLGAVALGRPQPLVDSPLAIYAKDPGPVEKARVEAAGTIAAHAPQTNANGTAKETGGN